jgi:predicted DNA-binding antitoxin AbrB/MazE fold protein
MQFFDLNPFAVPQTGDDAATFRAKINSEITAFSHVAKKLKVVFLVPNDFGKVVGARQVNYRGVGRQAAGKRRLANTKPDRYFCLMTTTVDAIYEHGKLVLPRPLSLPEKSHVRVTIESDPEREAWLKLSGESLTKVWDNDADDVFNELLKK